MSIPVKEEPNYEEPAPPRADWPSSGQIDFENVNVRYRENLPLVLKNLNLQISDKEKIGIVGRTGSGKSTIILALKRMIDLAQEKEQAQGVIKVDGVNIHSMGLKHYRPAVVLIPQDPFLLSGTVRSNIDPFNKYSDEEIEKILKKTQIFDNLYDTTMRVLTKSSEGKKEEGFPLETPSSENRRLVESDSEKTKKYWDSL